MTFTIRDLTVLCVIDNCHRTKYIHEILEGINFWIEGDHLSPGLCTAVLRKTEKGCPSKRHPRSNGFFSGKGP